MRPTAEADTLITSATFRRISPAFIVALVCLTCFLNIAIAGPGDLDGSFGTLGRVISSPDATNRSLGRGMVLQPDGKIVMVGIACCNSQPNFLVFRYNTDGSPDNDFGTSGLATITFPVVFVRSARIALQPDGRIVVAGSMHVTSTPFPQSDVGLARLNSDGTPDNSFDGDGRAIVNFNDLLPGRTEYINTLKIAPDGKVVIGGYGLDGGVSHKFVLARLNGDGSPDATFGTSGRYVDAQENFSSFNEMPDIAILSDGSIVAACYVLSSQGTFRVAFKVNASGTVREWRHAVGGPNMSTLRQAYAGIRELPNGQFLLVGRRDDRIAAFRLNADGSPDNSFAAPILQSGLLTSMGIQSDGKIVATVSSDFDSDHVPTTFVSYSVIRFNPDGTLDTAFAPNGIANTTVLNSNDSSRDLIVQPDGKILVGGGAEIAGSPGQYYFAMVRYRGGERVPDNTTDFDYDGDGRADVSVFRPSNGVWYLDRSTAGFTAVAFGASTDRLVPADYDGDGKTDISIYRDGEWWTLQSSNLVVRAITFGIAEDKPQPGDYDGDGMDDIAVFRPSNNVWYVLRTTDWGYHSVEFGATGDIPYRGDYDDDGKTDFAVFRPSNGGWYIQRSSGGYTLGQFGQNGDIPVAADYDGDSKPDIAVWRPSNGVWYILRSGDGWVTSRSFGVATDTPVPADYDGDGRTDIAVFKPSDGTWYRINSSSGQLAQQAFGFGTDRPTPAAFGP